MRETVKIKSDVPEHEGFYTIWKDEMKEDDEIYVEGAKQPKKKKDPKKKDATIFEGVTTA